MSRIITGLHNGDKIVVTFEKKRDPTQVQRLSEDGILYDGGFDAAAGRPVVSEVLASKPKEMKRGFTMITTGDERKADESRSGLRWSMDQRYRGRILRAKPRVFGGHHLLDAKVSPDGRRVAYRIVDDSRQCPRSFINCFPSLFAEERLSMWRRGAYFIADYWWAA